MNKMQKGLIGIILPAIVLPTLLSVYGCREFTVGGFQPTDRSKSPYKQLYLEKANRIEINTRNAADLVDYYGSMKEWIYMDNVVREITKKDLKEGIRCGDRANKYYKLFKVKPSEVIKETEK